MVSGFITFLRAVDDFAMELSRTFGNDSNNIIYYLFLFEKVWITLD